MNGKWLNSFYFLVFSTSSFLTDAFSSNSTKIKSRESQRERERNSLLLLDWIDSHIVLRFYSIDWTNKFLINKFRYLKTFRNKSKMNETNLKAVHNEWSRWKMFSEIELNGQNIGSCYICTQSPIYDLRTIRGQMSDFSWRLKWIRLTLKIQWGLE